MGVAMEGVAQGAARPRRGWLATKDARAALQGDRMGACHRGASGFQAMETAWSWRWGRDEPPRAPTRDGVELLWAKVLGAEQTAESTSSGAGHVGVGPRAPHHVSQEPETRQ
jgi:hypothetical protein